MSDFQRGGPGRSLQIDGRGNAEAVTSITATTVNATTLNVTDNAASALQTTGANVNVSAAAPPVAGQVLQATSATTATWQVSGGAATDIATTGADVNVSAAAPPSAGQSLVATSASTATWQPPAYGGLYESNVSGTTYTFLLAGGIGPGNEQIWTTGSADPSSQTTIAPASGTITIDSGGAGTYLLTGYVSCRSGTSTWRCVPYVSVDGSQTFWLCGHNRNINTASGSDQSWTGTRIVTLAAGQVVTLRFVPWLFIAASEDLLVKYVSLTAQRIGF